jgi:monothiol glutaredoxin
LAKYHLPYTEKDIIQNPAFRWEMETKSGQPLSPCVEINGHMLADVSGEQVESYLIDNKLVQPSNAETDVPTNAPCATEQHEGAVKLNL